MVKETSEAHLSLGTAGYHLKDCEVSNTVFRRSIYAIQDIKAGEVLTESNIKRIRPGYGLAPKYFREILGRAANKDLERGTPLNWDSFD